MALRNHEGRHPMKSLLLAVILVLTPYTVVFADGAFFEIQLHNEPGALISGRVIFRSTDSAEDSENEPAEIHSSDGVLNKQILNRWNEVISFVFHAKQENITLTCSSIEFDEGVTDDSCQIAAAVNGWTAFTKKQKNLASQSQKPLTIAGAASVAAAVACLAGGAFTQAACRGIAAAGIAFGGFAGGLSLIVNDPTRDDFGETCTADVPIISNVEQDFFITSDIAKVLNRINALGAKAKAVSECGRLSADRAAGADEAGDIGARNSQTANAQNMIGKLGATAGAMRSALKDLLGILEPRAQLGAFNRIFLDQRGFMGQTDLESWGIGEYLTTGDAELNDEWLNQVRGLMLVAPNPQNIKCSVSSVPAPICELFPFVLEKALPALAALRDGLVSENIVALDEGGDDEIFFAMDE